MELTTLFQGIRLHHIYMELNKDADQLSKQALLEPVGRLTYFQWVGRVGGPHTHINLFESSFC
jgi:hypothetical protein